MKTLWMPHVRVVRPRHCPPARPLLPVIPPPGGRSSAVTDTDCGADRGRGRGRGSNHSPKKVISRGISSAEEVSATTRRSATATAPRASPATARQVSRLPTSTSAISPAISPALAKPHSAGPSPSPPALGRDSTVGKRNKKTSKVMKSKVKAKSKVTPKTVPVTTGGSILDINNSRVLEPESSDHLSMSSFESILNKQLPKRQMSSDQLLAARAVGVGDDACSSSAASLGGRKTNQAQGKEEEKEKQQQQQQQQGSPSRLSPARRGGRQQAGRGLLPARFGVSGEVSQLTAAESAPAPVSTLQLRAWFQTNGQQPAEFEQTVPAFPSKKKEKET
jgi:hypothetical protein